MSLKEIGENMYKFLFMTFILLFSASCGGGSNASEPAPSPNAEYMKLAHTQSLQQGPSNTAKETLGENGDITTIKAVNSKNDIVIGFEIHHLNRFNLKKIRKEIQKEMDKKFPDLNVIVSADKKIILELKRLEEKINADSITKKELYKKVKEIVKLDGEQT